VAVVRWLRERQETEILAVGHMPDLAALASYLLCGGIEVPLTFKKCAVCRITCQPSVGKGRGVLEWLMQPAQLRLVRSK
jgi:phosphohistidine phosphatase SixA